MTNISTSDQAEPTVAGLQAELDTLRAELKAKTDFLVDISHEIRTPLTGVMATASLLMEFDQSQRNRNYIGLIEGSGRTLLKILDDIFEISRIEAGRLQLEPSPTNPMAVINEVLASYKEDADYEDLSLRVESKDVMIPLMLDGVRLKQVLTNLVDNAVKFTEEGGVVISCTLSPTENNEYTLYLSISDTGIGIPKEHLESIFIPYRFALGSDHRLRGGSGLGLAISKKITQLMGGELMVDSNEGVGSTFTISLTAASALPSELRVEETSSAHRQNLRVLLAEDNEINTLIATEMLERLSCHVVQVTNGLEAVKAAENADFDLILLDIYMPECTGIEACRTMRLNDKHTKTTIGALTASFAPDEVRHCLRAGMDFVVGKPFSYAQLRDTLTKWFPDDIEELTIKV